MLNLPFTTEDVLYWVLFRHGEVSSKFNCPTWKELVTYYDLCCHDTMTDRIEHYGTVLGVDFNRGGDFLSPLPG